MFRTDCVITRLVKCIRGGLRIVTSTVLWIEMALLQFNHNYVNYIKIYRNVVLHSITFYLFLLLLSDEAGYF
jgi:hypothetical protein